jgi:hypothetical protein
MVFCMMLVDFLDEPYSNDESSFLDLLKAFGFAIFLSPSYIVFLLIKSTVKCVLNWVRNISTTISNKL